MLSGLKKGLTAALSSGKGKEASQLSIAELRANVNTASFPTYWLPSSEKTLGKQEPIDMAQSYTERLPRILVTVHNARGLSKASQVYCKIRMGRLEAEAFKSRRSGDGQSSAEWNEEFLIRVENGPDPFLCQIYVLSPATLVGAVAVDLFHDLGMRFKGDTRRWSFRLHTQGEVTVTFSAQTDLNFPNMIMKNIDGMAATVALPFKPLPELEVTVYQAIRLSGEKKLQSYVEIVQRSPHAEAANATRAVLRTQVFKGYSPFWGESVRVPLYSKADALQVSMYFQRGSKRALKEWQEERVCVLTLPELLKVATATESRRWYAFVGKFKGGAIGLGFKACSNMKAVEALPEDGAASNATPPQRVVKVDTKAPTIEELKAMAAAMQRDKALNAERAQQANLGGAPPQQSRAPAPSTTPTPPRPAAPTPAASTPARAPASTPAPQSAVPAAAAPQSRTPVTRAPVPAPAPAPAAARAPAPAPTPAPVLSAGTLSSPRSAASYGESGVDDELSAILGVSVVSAAPTSALEQWELDVERQLGAAELAAESGLDDFGLLDPLNMVDGFYDPTVDALSAPPPMDDLELASVPPPYDAYAPTTLAPAAELPPFDFDAALSQEPAAPKPSSTPRLAPSMLDDVGVPSAPRTAAPSARQREAELMQRMTLALPKDDLLQRIAELDRLKEAEQALVAQLSRLEAAAADGHVDLVQLQKVQQEWRKIKERRELLMTEGLPSMSGSATEISSSSALTDDELLGDSSALHSYAYHEPEPEPELELEPEPELPYIEPEPLLVPEPAPEPVAARARLMTMTFDEDDVDAILSAATAASASPRKLPGAGLSRPAPTPALSPAPTPMPMPSPPTVTPPVRTVAPAPSVAATPGQPAFASDTGAAARARALPTPAPIAPAAAPSATSSASAASPRSLPTTRPLPTSSPVPSSSQVTATGPASAPRAPPGASGVVCYPCTLCKQSYPKSQLALVRNKPFCSACKTRLAAQARQRGMNL